jgi:glutamate synthase (NADPH/NADH) small chain
MPARVEEVHHAKDERVHFEMLVNPVEFFGDEKGNLTSIECIRQELGEPDESGRRKAVPIEGSDFKRETDMVVLAIGEAPDLRFLPKQFELNEDGTVWVNPVTMETSVPGVFAAGDVRDYRYRQAITAAADGCKAAIDADRFLAEHHKN